MKTKTAMKRFSCLRLANHKPVSAVYAKLLPMMLSIKL